MSASRTALVTGGNRGIGFEVCRQLAARGLRVLLGARDPTQAAARLKGEGLDVTGEKLDVTLPEDVTRIAALVRDRFGSLDVLVNNAGVMQDSMLTGDLEGVRRSMEVNLYGPLRLCQAFVPQMQARRYGRIVNVSTGMAQLSSMGGGWAGYRLSKTALNALTRVMADETRGSRILVNAVDPGWVKTDMGGASAPRAVPVGAAGIVWAATLPDDGPTGGFFRDGKPIPW
jgi:NAD(P)-dependent dehydrogenase (short-subunit alcohol dehydrogenase family)